MRYSGRAPWLLGASALAAVSVLCACTGSSGGSSTSAAAPGAPKAPASDHSTPKAHHPHHGAGNPLTGEPHPSKNRVIAVKIDDTPPGRPQVGVDKADIVYVEEAEGGLDRLVAIFDTHMPTVGYVRSTRPSDPDLLLQYGKITEAASGGGHDALPLLHRSGLHSWIQDDGAGYYYRASRAESDYINVLLPLRKVQSQIRSPRAKSIGLTWSPSTPLLKHATKATDVRTTVGSQQVEFKWDAKMHRYVRYIDGQRQVAADGKPVSTPNVVVQVCKIVPHPQDTDVNGNPSQFTYTTGRGRVAVFRNGHRINGVWTRKFLKSGTTLRSNSGKRIPLATGGAWFALVRRSASISG